MGPMRKRPLPMTARQDPVVDRVRRLVAGGRAAEVEPADIARLRCRKTAWLAELAAFCEMRRAQERRAGEFQRQLAEAESERERRQRAASVVVVKLRGR